MCNACIPPEAHGTGYDPMDEYVVPVGRYSREQQQDELKRAEQRQADGVQHIIDVVLKQQRCQAQGTKDLSIIECTVDFFNVKIAE